MIKRKEASKPKSINQIYREYLKQNGWKIED